MNNRTKITNWRGWFLLVYPSFSLISGFRCSQYFFSYCFLHRLKVLYCIEHKLYLNFCLFQNNQKYLVGVSRLYQINSILKRLFVVGNLFRMFLHFVSPLFSLIQNVNTLFKKTPAAAAAADQTSNKMFYTSQQTLSFFDNLLLNSVSLHSVDTFFQLYSTTSDCSKKFWDCHERSSE